MSPRQAVQGHGGGGRMALTALLVVGVAVGMLLLVRATPGNEPFDPSSGDADGTRGLVLLLEQYGATVDVVRDVPEPGAAGRLLVLEDRLDGTQRDAITAWVEAGGVAVVADPQSELTAGRWQAAADDRAELITVGECEVPALAHLRAVYVPSPVTFAVPAAARGCFARAGRAFVVAAPLGDGTLVGIGGNRPFTNAYLRQEDNAALATALLAPEPGRRVTILLGSGAATTTADIGTGDETLMDLVRPGVWMALAQLALAFVVLALAMGVRPGRPVREPDQVPIAGSELVVATGNLMQRARHAQRAGWLLRGRTYRSLCRRLLLPSTAPIATVDEHSARVLGTPPGAVAALLEREVHDDAALLALSAELHRLRALAEAAPPTASPLPEGALQ